MTASRHSSLVFYHLLALATACIWGSTFVVSKLLLMAGLSPAEIMCLRFAISYVFILALCRTNGPMEGVAVTRRQRWRDEMLFAILGITGGSWYFFSENTALSIGSATQVVALIVCTTPVVSSLLLHWFWGERLDRHFYVGSAIALGGVALVVFNGVFVLDDNPWVAVLAASASLSWAIYSIVLRDVERRYSSVLITRKVFLWGLLTMLPYFAWQAPTVTLSMLVQPAVVVPLLYLSLVCSLGCFLVWTVVCRRLGVVDASNYLYFNPVTSLIMAAVVLDERITLLAVVGCLLVIGGVWLCNRKKHIGK